VNENDYKIIKLKPQRVKGQTGKWVFGRNRGYIRDWRRAIDQSARKLTEKPIHWLDDHLDN
jgi:hypothetical protein